MSLRITSRRWRIRSRRRAELFLRRMARRRKAFSFMGGEAILPAVGDGIECKIKASNELVLR
jgi:hypothetical protein